MTERNNTELKTFTAFRVRQSPMNMHLVCGNLTPSGCQTDEILRSLLLKFRARLGPRRVRGSLISLSDFSANEVCQQCAANPHPADKGR